MFNTSLGQTMCDFITVIMLFSGCTIIILKVKLLGYTAPIRQTQWRYFREHNTSSLHFFNTREMCICCSFSDFPRCCIFWEPAHKSTVPSYNSLCQQQSVQQAVDNVAHRRICVFTNKTVLGYHHRRRLAFHRTEGLGVK